jgi:hypothetical protein
MEGGYQRRDHELLGGPFTSEMGLDDVRSPALRIRRSVTVHGKVHAGVTVSEDDGHLFR